MFKIGDRIGINPARLPNQPSSVYKWSATVVEYFETSGKLKLQEDDGRVAYAPSKFYMLVEDLPPLPRFMELFQ